MVLEAGLSFHKGQTEKDFDSLKLRKTSPLKDQVATEPQNLVRSNCQNSNLIVTLGAIKEKVHQISTTIEPINGTHMAFKEGK